MKGLRKRDPMVKRSSSLALTNGSFPRSRSQKPLGMLKPNQLAISTRPSIARFAKKLGLIFLIPSTMQILYHMLQANTLENHINLRLQAYRTQQINILRKKQPMLLKDASAYQINQLPGSSLFPVGNSKISISGLDDLLAYHGFSRRRMIAIYGIQDVDSEDHATELNWPLDSGNPVHPHKTARNQLPLLNQSALIKSTGKDCSDGVRRKTSREYKELLESTSVRNMPQDITSLRVDPKTKAQSNSLCVCASVTNILGSKKHKDMKVLSAYTGQNPLLGRPQNPSFEYPDLNSKNTRCDSPQFVRIGPTVSPNENSNGRFVLEIPRLTFRDQPGVGPTLHSTPHIDEPKEIKSPNSSQRDPKMTTVDLDRLSNKIYSLLERRLAVERERRGI